MTGLHYAAKSGDFARCNAFIAQGLNVNALIQDRYTPLHLAAINGHVQIRTILLNAGANIDGKTSMGGPCFTSPHIKVIVMSAIE